MKEQPLEEPDLLYREDIQAIQEALYEQIRRQGDRASPALRAAARKMQKVAELMRQGDGIN